MNLLKFPLLLLTLLKLNCVWAGRNVDAGYTPIVDPGQLTSRTVFAPASLQLERWAATHSQESAGTAKDDFGCPFPSLTASLGIESRGPLLLQDAFLLTELATFNRERIPERVVHAKGNNKYFCLFILCSI